MKRVVWTFAALLLLAGAWPSQAQSTALDRARTDVREVELAFERTLMRYPGCGDPADDFHQAIRNQAQQLNIADFTLTPVAESEAVPASPFRIERLGLRGLGEFGDVIWLLRRLTALRYSRVVDFETVHLQAGAGRSVVFDGTMAIACRDHDSSFLKIVPPRGRTPEEMELGMYLGRMEQFRAALEAAKQLDERMQPNRIVDALRVLGDVWGHTAVGVHELRYTAPALTLQGVALGASAKAAVESTLRTPRFELGKLEWAPAGDCQAFSAAGRLTAADEDAGEALPLDIFLARDAKSCAPIPPAATSVAKRGSGPLSIHLRNVDVSTVFLVLHDLSPTDGFVVEPDVAGRLSVDFENVTVDEALAALSAAGVAFASPGPLRRICRTACGEPTIRPGQPEGEPISFSVTASDVIDLLQPLQHITGLRMHAPRGLKGDLSLYVTDAPWDAVLETIISAFDLTYTLDKTDFYIGDRATTIPLEQFRPTFSGTRSLTEHDRNKLAAADFRLAGIAGANGTWKAYGRLLGLPKLVLLAEKDTPLLDATVAAVAADRVTLRTKGGQDVVVTLP